MLQMLPEVPMQLVSHIICRIYGIPQTIRHAYTIMANWDLTCNTQALQRSKFFFLEYGKSGVDSSVQSNNPYEYNNTGELKYSPSRLNMRRKAEILKYNKNRSVTQSSNKGKWTYLSNIRPTNNRSVRDKTVCPNTPQPSSSSGVPGPVIPLILDESVPLYNYILKPVYQRVGK